MSKSLPFLLAVVALAVIACGSSGANTRPTRTIGTVVAVGVRAQVVATRTGSGAAPTARVTVQTERLDNGHWRRIASRRLDGTYFWKTVTAAGGICRLELVTAAEGRTRAHVGVQLLVTPSIGCGKELTVTLAR